MMEKEVVNYKGYTIVIKPSMDYENPDDWGNDDMFVVYDHRDFTVKREGFDCTMLFEGYYQKGKNIVKVDGNSYWLFGVDAYIHGGVVLALRGSARAHNFPDRRWDVSFKGFALVRRMKGWSWTVKQATDKANILLEEWNDCLSGNVYDYLIIETGDRCCGFTGDWKTNALVEAKSVVDGIIERNKTTKNVITPSSVH